MFRHIENQHTAGLGSTFRSAQGEIQQLPEALSKGLEKMILKFPVIVSEEMPTAGKLGVGQLL